MKPHHQLAFMTSSDTKPKSLCGQTFKDGEVLKTALNDSIPLVTGEEFDNQMEIWFSAPNHARFKDPAVMPGFHEVLRIFQEGQFWAVSDKAYPWTYNYEGASRPILYEWLNMWDPAVAGASRNDANWADNVKSKLGDWNTAFNQRFEESSKALKDGLKQFYGYKDSDFE